MYDDAGDGKVLEQVNTSTLHIRTGAPPVRGDHERNELLAP